MSLLKSLKSLGGNLASLDDFAAIFDSLAKIDAQYDAIAAAVRGTAQAISKPADLIALILGEPADAGLESLFATLGLAGDIAQLRAAKDRIPVVDTLLTPVNLLAETADASNMIDSWTYGSNKGAINLPLFDKSGSASASDFSLALSGDASVECEAGALWPITEDKVDEKLIRLGARLTLGAGAKAAVPLFGVRLGAGGEASLACAVQYFHRPKVSDGLFATEAGRAIAGLANPFDYASVWDSFAHSSLYGLIIDVEGATRIGVTISIAQDVITSTLIKADVGLSFAASVKRAGQYQLVLRGGAFADGASSRIRMSLIKSDGKEKSYSIGAGLDVDLSGLGARVHETLEKALVDWDGALLRFRKYLNIGDYLKTALLPEVAGAVAGLVGDPALRSALAADIDVALGLDAGDESQVAAWLDKHFRDALADASGVLAKAGGEAQAIVDQLALRIPALARDQVRALAKTHIDTLVTAIDTRFTQEVAGLVANPPADLAKKLKSIGATVSGTINSLDTAIAPIRDLISKYDALFRTIVAESGNQARAKIAARLNWERQKISRVAYEIQADFTGDTVEAAAIYHDLIAGDLDRVKRLIDDPAGKVDGFDLIPGQSSITRFSQVSKSVGYEAVLFGIGFSGKRLSLAEATLKVDGDGTIRVDASSLFERERATASEDRKVRIVSAYSLVSARHEQARLPEARQAMRGSFNMEHGDENLKLSECEGFFGRLLADQLISADQYQQAMANFSNWRAPGDKVRGRLSLDLKLTSDHARRLMCFDLQPAGALALEHQQMLGMTAITAMVSTQDWKRDNYQNSLNHARKKRVEGVDPSLNDDALLAAILMVGLTKTSKPGDINAKDDNPLDNAMKRAYAFAQFVKQMRDIMIAEPAGAADQPGSGKWGEGDYRKAEDILSKHAKVWLKLNSKFLGSFKAEMHPTTSAFIQALLCAANRPDGLVPTSLSALTPPANGLSVTMVQMNKQGAAIGEPKTF